MKTVHNLIIIGSGPSALTAAIYAARAKLSPLVFEGKEPGGQLMKTTAIENWPGNISILGPTLMLSMREQAIKSGAQLIAQEIKELHLQQQPLSIKTRKGELFQTRSLIIATGSTPRMLKCPGEDTYWGKGVSACAVCDGAFYKDKKVVIIGGGDSAMENASFMTKFTNEITIVQLFKELSASPAMKQRVLDNKTITILYEQGVSEIKGNGSQVTGILLKHASTNVTQELPADAVFLAIGHHPATDLVKNQLECDRAGYIITNNKSTKTSLPGVFAAGDVADPHYRQAITAAGSGCMAALDVQEYLAAL